MHEFEEDPYEDEEICGITFDHDEVTEEVDGLIYWYCRECGAEGYDDA